MRTGLSSLLGSLLSQAPIYWRSSGISDFGSLFVTTDRGAGEVPTFDGLGATSHLYFIPD